MSQKQRVNFGSRLGVLAAAAGSAIGLGNIWRFPYELGQNGGFAFLIVYLLCALMIGWPLMLSEFTLGRMGQSNVAGSFRSITHVKHWQWIGVMGVGCALLIMGFYSVVCGWTLEYVYQAVTDGFSGKTPTDLSQAFTAFSSNTARPILWMLLFLFVNCSIVLAGVQKGIERSAKMLMPFLFLILIVLCVRSVTLPGGMEGLKFLFAPDFSKITPSVILSAMGQAFFSLSLGMGCMVTYGSYISKQANLERTALEVTGLDTLMAILCAVTIFPAVFAMGIDPSQGPELVFITLPTVFNQMPGGYLWAILFFLLLSIAALTSTISLLEVITAYISEELRWSRKLTAIVVSLLIALLGVACSLSMGVWSEFRVFGLNLFDLFDKFTSYILMPLGGIGISLFMGWHVDRKRLELELSNEGTLKLKYIKVYVFLLKYVTPLAILLVFINQIVGLF